MTEKILSSDAQVAAASWTDKGTNSAAHSLKLTSISVIYRNLKRR